MVSAGYDSGATFQTGYVHTNITACISAISELTEVIITPTLHTTFRSDYAGMCDTSRDRVTLTAGHRDEAGEGH